RGGMDEPDVGVALDHAGQAREGAVGDVEGGTLGEPHVEPELSLARRGKEVDRKPGGGRDRDREQQTARGQYAPWTRERPPHHHRIGALEPAVAGVEGTEQAVDERRSG